MKKLLHLILLIFILGCSPKIKSIIEYNKNNSHLTKSRVVEFDEKGNKILERNFGNQRSNRIVKIEYKNGKKIKATDCDHFEKQDTCVVRQFSVYEYNPEKNLKIQTMYESDSAVRFIRKYQRVGNLEVIKTNTWDMLPTQDKVPDLEKAMKLTDSIFYDSKDRVTEERHYNEEFREPWMEKYQYSKNGYSKEISGTRNDTIIYSNYSPLEKLAKRKNIDFNFHDTLNYKYEIIYY